MKSKVSSIAFALGNVQSMRKSPPAESLNTQVPESPRTRATESPDTRPGLSLQNTAKRTHPDRVQAKAYVRPSTKTAAWRKWQDEGRGDFSDLIQHLLEQYLRT